MGMKNMAPEEKHRNMIKRQLIAGGKSDKQ